MPLKLGLNKESSDDAIQSAISKCIRMERRAGHPGNQAAAICYARAREETGKTLGKK